MVEAKVLKEGTARAAGSDLFSRLETQDAQTLNCCLRDLIALSTLPAMWHGAKRERIAENLAASLFTTLNPDFVYVGFPEADGQPPVNLAQTGRYQTDPALGEALAPDIRDWVRAHDPDEILLLPHSGGSGQVRVITSPIGHHAEFGIIAVGFFDKSGPEPRHRLLLNVAATQATSAMRNARLVLSLQESRERLAAALEGSGAGTFRWNIHSDVIEWDENLDRLFGLPPGRTVRSLASFIEAVHADDQAGVAERCAQSARDGADFDMEFKVVWPDGTEHWLHDKGKTFFGTDGRPLYMTGVCVDITERKRAEQALRETTRRLDAILNNTQMAVFLMDDRQHCVYMNEAAEKLIGYTFAETQGRPLHDVIHHTYPDGRPFPLHECAIDRAFPEDNQIQGEEVFVHKDGSFYPVGFTASPIRDDAGRPVGTIIEVRNIEEDLRAREAMQAFNEALKQRVDEAIAERKRAEAQLLQAQKMEAVGRLTGGVAHDFNNLLQVIAGNLQLLLADVAGNQRGETRVRNALLGVSRGSNLASQLLAFSRRQILEPKPVHLGRLVRDMDDMLRRSLGEGVEIETVVAGGLWNCLADPAQVENALLNLAINARDAMDGLGKLTIEAGNAYLDDDYAAAHADVAPGQYVMLAVTDTGCGIPPDMIERVIEPFYTTKGESEGTGLGLSMVYGFVKQSGGHLKLYSEPGHGTTVKLYLPRTRQAEDVPAAVSDDQVRGGSETVLVVEDDDDVRVTVVEMLADLGYSVLKAKDGPSALAIIDGGAAIDLLFTDVVMPGAFRGPELAQRARERLPELAVLFTSGYTQNAIVHAGRLDDNVELLPKPYGRDDLARKVRHVLSKRQPQRAEPAASPVGAEVPAALRVLVVEDEILIRLATAAMLTDLGHAVVEAGSVAEALRLLETEAVDVLLTDFSLPDGKGDRLAAAARRRNPHLGIVFATGYDIEHDQFEAGGIAGAAYLRKPYDHRVLGQALSTVAQRR